MSYLHIQRLQPGHQFWQEQINREDRQGGDEMLKALRSRSRAGTQCFFRGSQNSMNNTSMEVRDSLKFNLPPVQQRRADLESDFWQGKTPSNREAKARAYLQRSASTPARGWPKRWFMEPTPTAPKTIFDFTYCSASGTCLG
eukprot:gnl/MRDRNA2_/MRDRNA2_158493_c0_seq1.p1 gnl/MRDRNA2_/MRDRNA2_158493_c0~~gnl/MRDRNA2_/MRDRNA2_158493_c0_seq1.p1  ORF type:complete len:142 (+),score=19.07 gnl/MRDRNA2_/MRDRNA2_158493_c0_seq1:191-616(+)